MASEVLKLTAQIVMSHASMTELSAQELVEEIKEVYKEIILERFLKQLPQPFKVAPPTSSSRGWC